MSYKQQQQLIGICFYSLWVVLGLLQSYNTELLADEAYYWKYSQDLSWGYFDHPPVVAVMIKIGYSIFQNELGVRLLFFLSSAVFIYLLQLLIQPKKLLHFYLSIASVAVVHFLGFLALPDMPLLLFTAAFLYLYKKYLHHDSWATAILIGITATLLLLSKYHGILIIGFVVLSNPLLLKRKTFWASVVVAVAIFLPHVQWQIAHDFPSIKYHLQERSTEGYKLEFTLNYLLSVLLMFSPIVGIALGWQALKNKTTNLFDRALKYVFIGSVLFFLLMSFKGRTEGNWIAIAIAPALILGYQICEQKTWFSSFIKTVGGISVVLILLARLLMAVDILPNQPTFSLLKEKLYYTRTWANAIHEKAKDYPVVFMNKYQHAAWYEFYTGNKAISLNNRMGRKNQYNIWDDEHELQGKTVMIIPNYYIPTMDSIVNPKKFAQYYYMENFRSASAIQITPTQTKYQVKKGSSIEVQYTISTNQHNWDYEANPSHPAKIHAILFQKAKLLSDNNTGTTLKNNMINTGNSYTTTIQAPEQAGVYALYLDIKLGDLPPAINSEKIDLTVVD